MGTPQEVQKLFDKTQDEMLQEATVKIEFAIEDVGPISSFDTKMDLPFFTICKNRLAAAKLIPTDNVVVDQVAQKSDVVKGLLNDSRNAFQDLKHFINKAFEGNNNVKKEFGYDDYEDARKSQPKMIVFMNQLTITVGKYNTRLTDQGMPAALATRISTLAKDLEAANKEQEVSKSERSGATQDRIMAYNNVWKDLQVICSAGKRAFSTNYAKYRRYILYSTNQQPPELPDEYDVLPAGATVTALTEFTTVTPILFKNAGETDIRCFRNTKEDEPNGDLGFDLTAGAEVVKDIEDIPGIGDFINVTNLSKDKEGLYLVRMAE
jgi:hypothetical protein